MLTIPTYATASDKYGKVSKDYVWNFVRDLAKQYDFYVVKDEPDDFIVRRMIERNIERDFGAKLQISLGWIPARGYGKAEFKYLKESYGGSEKEHAGGVHCWNEERIERSTGSYTYFDLQEDGHMADVDGWIALLLKSVLDLHVTAWQESAWPYGCGEFCNEADDNFFCHPFEKETVYNDDNEWKF